LNRALVGRWLVTALPLLYPSPLSAAAVPCAAGSPLAFALASCRYSVLIPLHSQAALAHACHRAVLRKNAFQLEGVPQTRHPARRVTRLAQAIFAQKAINYVVTHSQLIHEHRRIGFPLPPRSAGRCAVCYA
jgi:hypothetical protein